MGLEETANEVFLIDLGLAQSYMVPETSQHIVESQSIKFHPGTLMYASINAQSGL